jgi:hypothetical protein
VLANTSSSEAYVLSRTVLWLEAGLLPGAENRDGRPRHVPCIRFDFIRESTKKANIDLAFGPVTRWSLFVQQLVTVEGVWLHLVRSDRLFVWPDKVTEWEVAWVVPGRWRCGGGMAQVVHRIIEYRRSVDPVLDLAQQ